MKTKHLLLTIVLIATMLLTSCNSQARVGALRSESKSVELGDAKSVRAEINFGAGDLELSGGADKLLEAGFNYNVAALKPEVEYTDGTLVVRQPETNGMPDLRDITDFRNEWTLRLNDKIPMDLKVNIGAGSGNLRLSGLSLTGLVVTIGAGTSTVDLSGGWARDLNVSIDTGAANITVKLPREVGVRVNVEEGPHTIETTGLTKDGGIYTNAAYRVAEVTMQIDLQAGIGTINLLEIE